MKNTEEKHNEEEIHIPEELVQSIGELGKLCSQQEECGCRIVSFNV